jgi:hypothetical protein
VDDEPYIVEAAASPDGLNRWRLLRRRDGLYVYNEDTFSKETYWTREDRSEFDAEVIEYWAPTHFSGLFDTLEVARTNAFSTLPWLRPPITQAETNVR